MAILHYDIECPACRVKVHVPFVAALEAKAREDYDLAEIDAQKKLEWFNRASLWQLIKFWGGRLNKGRLEVER